MSLGFRGTRKKPEMLGGASRPLMHYIPRAVRPDEGEGDFSSLLNILDLIDKPDELEKKLRESTEWIDNEVWALDWRGRTHLSGAAVFGRLDSVKILIKYGASPYKRDEQGRTALGLASLHNRIEIVRYLLTEAKVPVDQICHREGTALHDAASQGHLDVAKLLVRHGADVNAKTVDNATPAMLAVLVGGNQEVVTFLISHGASQQELLRTLGIIQFSPQKERIINMLRG